MQRINVRLLVIVFVTIAVLSTGVVVVHGIQMSRNVDTIIRRAEAAKEKDPKTALGLYRRYHSMKPNDLEHFADYALFASEYAQKEPDGNRYLEAIKALNQLVHGYDCPPELRTKLLNSLVSLNILYRQFTTARDDLLELKNSGVATAKNDLQLARCEIVTGQYDDAVKLLEQLVGLDPESKTFDDKKATAPNEIEAYFGLASLLREKITDSAVPKRNELADQVVDRLIANNPKSSKALLFQAQYLSQYGSRDLARKAVEQALAADPENADVLLQSADIALQTKDFAAADERLSKGIKLFPQNDRMYFLWVRSADAQQDPKEAQRRLNQALEANPDSAILLDTSFQRELLANDFAGAHATLKKIGTINFPAPTRRFLEAKLMMAEGDYAQASKNLEELRPELIKSPELTQKADLALMDCYNNLKQWDKALDAGLRSPNSPAAQLGIGKAYIGLGKPGEAIEHYKRFARLLDPEKQPEAAGKMAQLILQLLVADQVNKDKDSRDWKGVDAMVADFRQKKLLTESADSLLQIEILSQKGEPDKARQIAQDLAQKYPEEPAVVSAAINLAMRNQNAAEAVRLIDSAPEKMRTDPAMIIRRLEAQLSVQGTPDELKASLGSTVEKVEKLPAEQRTQIYPALAIAYLRLGDRDAAKTWFKKATELDPHNANIRLSMFQVAQATGDLDGMKEVQQWYEKENPGDTAQCKLLDAAVLIATVDKARQMRMAIDPKQHDLDATDEQNLLRARGYLQEVHAIRPGWAEGPKLLADIDQLEEEDDHAIDHLQEVLSQGQPNAEVVDRLARLLSRHNRSDEAKKLLEKYGSLVGENSATAMIQVQLAIQQGKFEEADQRLQKLFEGNPKNPLGHFYRGQLKEGAGKSEEAEKEYREAVKLAPDLADAWVSLVHLLIATHRGSDALEAVQNAQLALPEDRRALAMGHLYEVLGDESHAEANYLDAIASSPDELRIKQHVAQFYLRFNHADKAKKYLDEILQSNSKLPADKATMAWARRTSAELLAANASYTDFRKAIEMLLAQGEQASDDDLVVAINLLYNYGDPASSRQALELLDRLKRHRNLSWRERLTLAQLEERAGDSTEAIEEMQHLLGGTGLAEGQKPDPSVLIAYAEMQLRRHNPEDAILWLKQYPNSGGQVTIDVFFLMARAYAMQGHAAEAANALLQLLPKERPLADDKWPLVRLVATDLQRIGQYAQAEKLFREDFEHDPTRAYVLGESLAQQGKIDATLDFVEQNRRTISPANGLRLLSVVLRQSKTPPTAAQIQQVQKRFDQALQEDAKSAEIQMILTDFLDFQHRWDEVEKLYRSLVARTDLKDSDRGAMLNNLAFLLAMQGKNRDEAAKFSDEALKLFGPQSDVLDTHGMVYLSKGDIKQALADLNDAVVITDPAPLKFVHLAMVQAAAKDEAAARASLDKAKALNFKPDDLSPLEKPRYDALLQQLNIAA